jgi:hypothetical protein
MGGGLRGEVGATLLADGPVLVVASNGDARLYTENPS